LIAKIIAYCRPDYLEFLPTGADRRADYMEFQEDSSDIAKIIAYCRPDYLEFLPTGADRRADYMEFQEDSSDSPVISQLQGFHHV
jgi:hypothetical protein